MAWTEKDVNGRARDLPAENGFLKEPESSPGPSISTADVTSSEKAFERRDSLSYANILRSGNKFVDALALCDGILEKDSGCVEAHIGKRICLQMQNMGRPAFKSFAEAIRLDPQNACALSHCGVLCKHEGHLVDVADSYQKALRADPSYKPAAECLAIVLTDLGTSLKLANNTQDGIQKYHEALKMDPHYAPAYYNLGVVYSEMMQYDTALCCYEKAALERPSYAEAYCNMGVIYKNRGDLESAIACYERCLAVSPNFEIAKNNMAIALTDLVKRIKLALQLASDVSALQNLRMSLRDLMSKSPVCDGQNICSLEATYWSMWHWYCKGDVPSLRYMEMLQKQGVPEELTIETSQPKSITISKDTSPGSIKSNGVNQVPLPMLNLTTCEENGSRLNQITNSGKLTSNFLVHMWQFGGYLNLEKKSLPSYGTILL